MKRYLILSTLDVSRMPNNRDHHLLQHIAPRFDETYVVFRKRCDKQGKLQFLRDAFVPRARVARRGGVSYVEVNPLLNHAQGLAMDVAGTYDVREHERGRFNLRQAAYRLLTSLGIFKDLSSIFFLFWFAWRKAPGKFDVCTALGPWAGASAFLLKKLGKVRVTVFEDRDYEPGFLSTPLRRRMAVAIEVAALKAADLRISVGGRLARLRQAQTGMPVATVHNGVAVENFQAPLRDLSQPILVYTGAVTFWSGLETVIQALPAIARALPAVRLRVAGEGLAGYRRELEALVAALKLGDRVEFLGRVENARIPAILADAHLGVATFRPLDLRRYAFPLKLLEYMAAGLPAIGTEDTETADILAKHDCGVSVPFTAEAFAAATIALLGDPTRYRRMAQNARAAVDAGHRWRDLMDREYALIHETWMRQEVK